MPELHGFITKPLTVAAASDLVEGKLDAVG